MAFHSSERVESEWAVLFFDHIDGGLVFALR